MGTAKGNLLIYNKKTLKKTNVANKHAKKITSGAWSKDNMLVLAGEDRQVADPQSPCACPNDPRSALKASALKAF